MTTKFTVWDKATGRKVCVFKGEENRKAAFDKVAGRPDWYVMVTI